jgi:hypothetical protein
MPARCLAGKPALPKLSEPGAPVSVAIDFLQNDDTATLQVSKTPQKLQSEK